ncbi:MAG TPA: hypothetical protein VG013_06135 [Gemmataceae bacterium]|nr:hypothetical protein [Gemmataceae bacterium]
MARLLGAGFAGALLGAAGVNVLLYRRAKQREEERWTPSVLDQWRAGKSKEDIARICRLNPEAVQRILDRAATGGRQ